MSSRHHHRPTFGKGWISLEHFKRYPNSRRVAEFTALPFVYIWSNEHQLYWRPNRCGYTSDGLMAGKYTFNEALAATDHCGAEKGITYRSEAYYQ